MHDEMPLQNKILELWIKKSLITIVCINCYYFRIMIMVFNATFNNISVIWWRSALLEEETGVPGENHRPATSLWQTLSHNVVSSTPRHERDHGMNKCKQKQSGRFLSESESVQFYLSFAYGEPSYGSWINNYLYIKCLSPLTKQIQLILDYDIFYS
jgi:hypothetical protein